MAPLAQSDSQAATRDNFREFGKGRTYQKTKRRYGKKRANEQRIAVVLKNKRKAAAKKKTARKRR
jgi:hypothetical protein